MPEEKRVTLRQRIEYGAVRAALAALALAPSAWVHAAAAYLARAYYGLGGKRVGYAEANLKVAFPELDPAARRRLGRESYAHVAWTVVDVARSERWSERELLERVSFAGREHLDAALARGKGVLGLTLHLGAFEIGMRAVPALGVPVTAVGRPLRNPLTRARVNATRTRTGAELIEHRNVAPRMLRALRRGRLVGVLNDQYSRRATGVFVPFFGLRCSTSAGPATLALRTGAAVVPCYAIREGPERYRVTFLPPVEIEPSGDLTKDIETATAAYNVVLEAIIRRHPEQWMWSHRRFRHSPDLESDLYA